MALGWSLSRCQSRDGVEPLRIAPVGLRTVPPPARPLTNCITQISVVIGFVQCVAGDVVIKYLVKSVRL